jgi:hypothetical protein
MEVETAENKKSRSVYIDERTEHKKIYKVLGTRQKHVEGNTVKV